MLDILTAFALFYTWAWLRRPVPNKSRQWYRNVYLWSSHWRETRAKKLKEVGYVCHRCGTGGRLDVHHLTYKRIGKERMTDLEVLCRSCHKKEHSKVSRLQTIRGKK